jgi:hypothetical protein
MSHQYGNKSKSQLTSPTPAQLPAVEVSTGHIVYAQNSTYFDKVPFDADTASLNSLNRVINFYCNFSSRIFLNKVIYFLFFRKIYDLRFLRVSELRSFLRR